MVFDIFKTKFDRNPWEKIHEWNIDCPNDNNCSIHFPDLIYYEPPVRNTPIYECVLQCVYHCMSDPNQKVNEWEQIELPVPCLHPD